MNPLYLFGREMTPLRKLLLMKVAACGVPLSEYTATGNPMSFDTNVSKPLKSLVIPWTPTQSGTGDPSPENVRPISGVSGLTAMHCGKNLLQGMENGEIDQSTGQDKQGATTLKRTIGYIPVVPSGKCVVSGLGANGNFRVFSYGVDKAYIVNSNFPASDGLSTITVGATTHYIRFQGLQERFGENLQVELGETASTYSPYSGTSYPVTFPAEPGTVYGGTLDLTTGVLTAEYVVITSDGSKADDWSCNEQSTFLRCIFPNSKMQYLAKANGYVFANYFKSSSNVTAWTTYIGSTSNILFFVPLTDIEDKTAWLSYLSEHNLQICYELDTPVTYQLTPQEITSLIGTNVLWSDTNGSNTAVYLKKG